MRVIVVNRGDRQGHRQGLGVASPTATASRLTFVLGSAK